MRRLAPFLLLLSLLPAEPGLCVSAPRPLLDAAGKPLEVTVAVPTGAGVGLSFAMPGAGQLYLGETVKGWSYFGLTLGLGAAAAAVTHGILYPGVTYVPPESIWAESLQGFALSWLVMGAISAWDAAGVTAERQLPLNESGR